MFVQSLTAHGYHQALGKTHLGGKHTRFTNTMNLCDTPDRFKNRLTICGIKALNGPLSSNGNWKNGQTTIFIRNLLRLCSSFQFRNASPVLAIALGYLTRKQPYKSF